MFQGCKYVNVFLHEELKEHDINLKDKWQGELISNTIVIEIKKLSRVTNAPNQPLPPISLKARGANISKDGEQV